MGYMRHDAIVVVVSGYAMRGDSDIAAPDVEHWRSTLPEQWAALVVGPVKSVINDYVTWAFLPDGSKEGWRDSEIGDEYRKQFRDLFAAAYDDGSSPFDGIAVAFGDDWDDEELERFPDRHRSAQAATTDDNAGG